MHTSLPQCHLPFANERANTSDSLSLSLCGWPGDSSRLLFFFFLIASFSIYLALTVRPLAVAICRPWYFNDISCRTVLLLHIRIATLVAKAIWNINCHLSPSLVASVTPLHCLLQPPVLSFRLFLSAHHFTIRATLAFVLSFVSLLHHYHFVPSKARHRQTHSPFNQSALRHLLNETNSLPSVNQRVSNECLTSLHAVYI